MSCLPCFAKKEEKMPPPKAGVDVPVHVEVVTSPPPVVEETIVMNDPVPALQISSEAEPTPSVLIEPTPFVETPPTLVVEPVPIAEPVLAEPVLISTEPTVVVEPAEEQVRLAAEAERLAAERRLAEEQVRLAAEAERLAEERRLAEEQARLFAEAQRLEEERRLAEEKRLAEAAEVERRRQEEENRLAKEREMPRMSSIQPDTNVDVKVTTEPPSRDLTQIQPVEVALTASQVDFVCPVKLPPAPPAVSVRPLHQAFVPEDHETLLMIAKQSLRDLIEASSEVCINGPSYTALLHARCMVLDDVAELSVSLMQAARYPQVKVGPVRSNAGSKISVRAGLKYVDFGEIVGAPLVGDETARCVKHEGTPIMYFVRTGQLFTAVSPDGARMGKALYMEDEELGPIMQILSEPNVDMLLTLVGLLTTFLGNSEVCDDILKSTSG